jgi:hypothetical protein
VARLQRLSGHIIVVVNSLAKNSPKRTKAVPYPPAMLPRPTPTKVLRLTRFPPLKVLMLPRPPPTKVLKLPRSPPTKVLRLPRSPRTKVLRLPRSPTKNCQRLEGIRIRMYQQPPPSRPPSTHIHLHLHTYVCVCMCVFGGGGVGRLVDTCQRMFLVGLLDALPFVLCFDMQCCVFLCNVALFSLAATGLLWHRLDHPRCRGGD